MLYEGIHCRLALEQPARGVIVLRLTGWDVGEFGDAPMRETARLLEGSRPARLYIDARQLTARFVRRFAGLEETMRIYTDDLAFDRALGDAIAASTPGAARQAPPASPGR